MQPQTLDWGVYRESEDETGVDEGVPDLELRCWIQMMSWTKTTKFPSGSFEVPEGTFGFELAEADSSG